MTHIQMYIHQINQQMNSTTLSFSEYLLWSGFQQHSVPPYVSQVQRLESQYPNASTLTYMDIVAYLDTLVLQGFTARLRRAHLTAIKKYFDYLLETGVRTDHPCKYLQIKVHEKRNIIHTDLFTIQELQSMLHRNEYWSFLKTRNQLVISFLIWQAMMPQEISNVKIAHLDLDRGTIYLPGGYILQSRTLPLVPYQLELLTHYLHQERPSLRTTGHDSGFLFVCNKRSEKHSTDNINYLMETLKPLFSKNLTTKYIRDSVISHWLNEKKIPLDQVQLMAGHRSVSSTLRYKRENPRMQREIMNRLVSVNQK